MYTQIYSETAVLFIKRLKELSRDVLTKEVGLSCHRSRFKLRHYTYPLNIVLFEGSSRLGYFDSDLFEIGINKKMLFCSDEEYLKNLLRHELAHYLVRIQYGATVSSHGKEFHDLCRKFGWGRAVFSASDDGPSVDAAPLEEKVLRKIEKLLSLANSSNSHESQSATLKANELLMKYNLERLSDPFQVSEEEMVIRRALRQKKNSQKLSSISQILRMFFVRPVINQGADQVYLELFGSRLNVSVAEYVAHFLEEELERLWQQTKRVNPSLKGLAAKNSFYRGLAEGYCEKVKQQRSAEKESKALILLEGALDEMAPLAYPHLRRVKSRIRHCATSSNLGKKEGERLQIRKGIQATSGGQSSTKLIS